MSKSKTVLTTASKGVKFSQVLPTAGLYPHQRRPVAKRFRFAPDLVAALQPLEALVRMGTSGHRCKIKPYYERIQK